MKCRETKKYLLLDCQDGQLSDDLLAQVKDHIHHCPSCHQFEQTVIEITRNPFKNSLKVVPSENVWEGIKEKIEQQTGKSFFQVFFDYIEEAFLKPKYWIRFASVCVVAVIVLNVSMHLTTEKRRIDSYIENQAGFLSFLNRPQESYPDIGSIYLGTSIELFLM